MYQPSTYFNTHCSKPSPTSGYIHYISTSSVLTLSLPASSVYPSYTIVARLTQRYITTCILLYYIYTSAARLPQRYTTTCLLLYYIYTSVARLTQRYITTCILLYYIYSYVARLPQRYIATGILHIFQTFIISTKTKTQPATNSVE